MLGTRLASFLGLSEVVFAGVVAWVLLGEAIGPVQLLGGVLILGGIVLVRLERPAVEPVPLEIDLVPVSRTDPQRARAHEREPEIAAAGHGVGPATSARTADAP